MTDTAHNERFMRQLGIYDPTQHEHDQVTMIGCGGIGSFTALGLAKLGVPNLTLIDPDQVEDHNIPNQMFWPSMTGTDKVAATAGIIDDEFNNITTYATALPSDEVPPFRGLVLSGLDSMEARSSIWHECIKNKPRINRYIDARLSAQFIVAYAVNPTDPKDVEQYEATLYADDEAEDTLCTERGIIDVGLQVASLLTRATRLHFNGEEVPNITMMNQATYVTTQGGWVE